VSKKKLFIEMQPDLMLLDVGRAIEVYCFKEGMD
jgi:hypothetical protein